MTRTEKLNAAAGAGMFGAIAVLVWSLTGMFTDQQALAKARAALPPTAAATVVVDWTRPTPLIRQGPAQRQARLVETLTEQLARTGLEVLAINTRNQRPLGDGLYLIEVEVQARGAFTDARTLIAWAGVNREAVRLTSVSADPDPAGGGVFSFALWVVAA
jgi:hypothetical protein